MRSICLTCTLRVPLGSSLGKLSLVMGESPQAMPGSRFIAVYIEVLYIVVLCMYTHRLTGVWLVDCRPAPVCYDGTRAIGARKSKISPCQEAGVPTKTADQLEKLTREVLLAAGASESNAGRVARRWYPHIWPATIPTGFSIFLDTLTTSTLGN